MTGTDAGASPTPFRILTVCTGNICRSPMAERLLRAGLDERFPGQFAVESAGTGALVGNPIDPQVAGFIRVLGGTADGFAARQLTPAILQGQDLVLTLTREHRSRVVEMAPAMLRRTFTLREFARILPQLRPDIPIEGADHWRSVLPKAPRARTVRIDPNADDVEDPYRRPQHVYERANRLIWESIRTILQANSPDES